MALTKSDTLNARGILYIIGNNQTPFLNIIGGLNTGARVASSSFALSVHSSTNAASQNAQSEDTAAAAGTPETYTKTQVSNVTQIMKYDAAVTFKKASEGGVVTGLNNEQDPSSPDSLTFQRQMALLQMAKDVDFSFIQGAYAAHTNTATIGKTRGMLEAVSTNAVAAGSAPLSKALVDSLLSTMWTNGAVFQNPVILVNAAQKIILSNKYGYAPASRNVGGVNIQQIETDFGNVGVVLAPNMPAASLLVADVQFCRPVFNPIVFSNEMGAVVDMVSGEDIVWVRTAVTGAQFGGFYYSQIGLDYSNEIFHGKITGLAT